MSPRARRRGLRAAAAVAAIALAGCGPKKATPTEAKPDPVEPTAETPAAPATDFASCEAAVAEKEAPLAETDAACCQTMAEHYSADMDALLDWETRDACCTLLEWRGSSACTPWGPPTPPAMA